MILVTTADQVASEAARLLARRGELVDYAQAFS
jgi:hypothetical protein